MDYKTIQYTVEENIGILTYNRPEVVNAINRQMLVDLNEFWQERQEDLDTKVIIINGAGSKGFCSGLDIKEAGQVSGKEIDPESVFYTQKRFSSIVRLMRTCPQPVIAAVHGAALGGGLSFALAADIRLASDDAKFCAQYINIGTGGADMGSSYFLWRIVGSGRAAEICMTGETVNAEEAYRIGLANRLYPKEDLIPAAMDMAKVMAGKSTLGLRLTKDALNAGLNLSSLEDVNRMEDRNQAFLVTSGLMNLKPKTN